MVIIASRFGISNSTVLFMLGVGTGEITDAEMTTQVENAEYEAERLMKTTFATEEKSEHFTSDDGSNIYRVKATPLNRILEINVGGTAVSADLVKFDRRSGIVSLTRNAQATVFDKTATKNNFIRYEFSRLNNTPDTTNLVTAATKGTTKQLEVGTSMGVSVGDYVTVIGAGTAASDTLGQEEVVEVTVVSGTGITVDSLQYNHSDGDRIIRMQIPHMAKRLAETIAGIMGGLHMVGSTYTFATSYSIPEHSVTKGVPYPHFEKVLNRLTERQNDILADFKPEFGIA